MNTPEFLLADTLEKRRKQIEKAKAAHLSRQLQTRLQYARLKVHHGWQKQTLNEVENLYFHHYRARAPPRNTLKQEKSNANSGSQLSQTPLEHTTASASSDAVPLPENMNEQQEASPSCVIPTSVIDAPDEEKALEMQVDPPLAPSPTPIAEPTPAITTASPQPHNLSTTITSPPTPQPPAVSKPLVPTTTMAPLPSGQTTPNTQVEQPSVYARIPYAPTRTAIVPPPPSRHPPIPRHPQMPSSSSSSRSRGHSPAMKHSSSMPGSNVALTYDSFWSSHSAATNKYRSALTPPAAPYPILDRSESNVALPKIGTGYHFTLDTPSTTLLPKSIPNRTAATRKPTVPVTATAVGGVWHGLNGGVGG
ncbi:hypothetical protein K439DRAFT_603091 [Ramaria rubella]|nr:hypothetical protein K439DRAFT_603091 [Ramaria rubella]